VSKESTSPVVPGGNPHTAAKNASDAGESGCGTQSVVRKPPPLTQNAKSNAGTLIGMLPLTPERVDFAGFPKFGVNTYS
jgi:hypothetical protein